MNKGNLHEPVLVHEVIEYLHIENQARYIDATLGTAGHSIEIIKRGGVILGIEEDPEMLKVANESVKGQQSTFVKGNFRDIDTIAKTQNFESVDGIIFDLGVSNPQLTSSSRGFSFAHPNSDLDMRLDPDAQGLKASDLLNLLREDQLQVLFGKVLDWQDSRKLVKGILLFRSTKAFKTTGDFLQVCRSLKGKAVLHNATLPFLALRMTVNSELENLSEALPKAYSLLRKGGRLLVISFHSGEDALVKKYFREIEDNGARILTKKPITPGQKEIESNPRSRSAKMRVLEKI